MQTDLIPALGGSGFPFQTLVASIVRESNLFLVTQEIAWRDHGSDKFLDIVAVGDKTRLIIECKRTRKDQLIFLLPEGERPGLAPSEVHCIYLRSRPQRSNEIGYGVAYFPELETENASFCVVAGQGNESKLLEQDIQFLVRGTERYAFDRRMSFEQEHSTTKDGIACIPILVTTAPMFVAPYQPQRINVESGIYAAKQEDLAPIDVIRFTKEFSTNLDYRFRARTVLIVNSAKLPELLPKVAKVRLNDPNAGAGLEDPFMHS